MEEDQEEHLLSSVCQILICKIIYRSCVFLYMTWEERGGFMSRGAYIIEIRRFLILYTETLGTSLISLKCDWCNQRFFIRMKTQALL